MIIGHILTYQKRTVIQIKIHPLLDSLNEATFLRDLLHAYDISDVDTYLHPDRIEYQSPDMYKNMDVAVLLLKQHLTKMSKIAVLCDTDSDGWCSCFIICDMLRRIDAEYKPFFHTVARAHGIKVDSSDKVIDDILKYKPSLLIIPDASADRESCQILREHECDVIILDHHSYDFSNNPYAVIVNCLQQPETNQAASGALVASKFANAVLSNDKDIYSDLVAMSLISDVMDLRSLENRAYINQWQKDYEQFVNNKISS